MESRNSFRIDLNEDYVWELAVWFKRGAEIGRVRLMDLGPPQMLKGRWPHPRLENISAYGLALSFEAGKDMDESRFKDVLVLAYFKLVDPMGGNFEPLSMMTGYRVNGVKFYDGRMFMGLNLAYDAAPEPGEKVLRFNNASKYGIADLTKWCDDMNRLALSGEIPKVPGFRLSRLLTEIEALAQKKPGNPGPSKSA